MGAHASDTPVPAILAEVKPAHVPRAVLVENHRDFHWITEKICGLVEGKTPVWWWWCFGVAAIVASFTVSGLVYLVAAHAATGALLLLFLALGGSGSWDFAALEGARAAGATTLFVLALIGFGTKAAVVPFHVWLPDAHAAAPGHVSATLSGVMITMGFYGLARFLPWIGPATKGTAAVLIPARRAAAVQPAITLRGE